MNNIKSDINKQNKSTKKRPVGRPKTKDVKNTCKTININIPIFLINKWNDVKSIHGNNMTQYITNLMQKDMENNYDKYMEIIEKFNNI